MSAKEEFQKLWEEIRLELEYRLGLCDDEWEVLEEIFEVYLRYKDRGGISYKWGIEKLRSLHDKLYKIR